jgi:truncated hemoglobin YjbI
VTVRLPDDPPEPGSPAEWLGEGGTAALGADWTERCLADPALGYLLDPLGPNQRARMIAYHRHYLAELLGGPACSGARELDEAHAGLGIPRSAFDRVLAHLRDALRAARLNRLTAAKILQRVTALAPLVAPSTRHPPR